MDFLNKSWQQIRELFGSMTPGARIVTGVMLVAIAVSVVFLLRFQVVGGDSFLFGGQEFSQSELAAMQTACSEAGLNDSEIKGNRLQVPRAKQAAYIQAISKAGALPKTAAQLDDPNRTFSPFITSTQQELQEKARKQAKLASMLEEIQGIESVAVEYDEVRKSNISREVVCSAAITAKAVGSRELKPGEIRTIQRTVMMAIGNMQPENIVVIDKVTGNSVVGTKDGELIDPSNNEYAITKKYFEDQWREKIIERIQPTYGATNVQVNVELDETLMHVEESKQLSSPVVVGTETEKESSESTRGDPGGRPGVVPNTGSANSTSSVSVAQASSSQSTKSRENSESRVGGSITQIEKAKLVPKSVSVSIGIPERYYRGLWRVKNKGSDGADPPPMTQADMENLIPLVKAEVQNVVQPLIKLPMTGEDIFDYITVTPDYELPETPIELPTMSDHAFSWLAANWQTLGMMALGAFGLVFLRGMVKSAYNSTGNDPDAAHAHDDEEAYAQGTGEDLDDDEESTRNRRRFSTDGPSLKDELSELIQDDPDTAASVLRQWIGEAA